MNKRKPTKIGPSYVVVSIIMSAIIALIVVAIVAVTIKLLQYEAMAEMYRWIYVCVFTFIMMYLILT